MELIQLAINYGLQLLYVLLNDWGMALIMLAILVRTILIPVQIFTLKQRNRMKGIQEELRLLEDDKSVEVVQRYRLKKDLLNRAGVKPGKSALLALMQIPFFLAIYRVLSTTSYLSGAAFLWLPNLASPDSLWILPLVVSLTTYLQMKDEPQASGPILKLMPVVSFAFMATLPSAIVLYYAISGITQSAAGALMRRWL